MDTEHVRCPVCGNPDAEQDYVQVSSFAREAPDEIPGLVLCAVIDEAHRRDPRVAG
jgi:hypothetical protein